jgi:CubicO group peptidase (beta-lactamase class C family)
MKRRSLLAFSIASPVVAAAPWRTARPEVTSTPAKVVPMTGEANPELASIDRFMTAFMQKWGIPGGQCAVARDGRLVYARGFGTVNQTTPGAPPPPAVSPAAQFRIASSSKPITAVAVMRLVEQGRVGLEDRAFDILNDLTPPPGATPDPRLHSITVRQLLEHSGGFDSTLVDPQFNYLRSAADAFHHPRPATHVDIIRYAMGEPLAFTPGTKYVYSNFGYNVLGRVIEHRTKLSYGDAIRQLVLQPAGVKRMALMTRTSPQARLPDEVFYVDGSTAPPSWPIYEDDPAMRPLSYGLFDGSAMDAHGGWIANAIDLTRFLNAVGGSSGTQLLAPPTVATMLARPDLPQWQGKDQFYAFGWGVVPSKVEMTHNGALIYGTFSTVARLPGGTTFAILFNHLAADTAAMTTELQTQQVLAFNAVQTWPQRDLYSSADP